MIPTSFEESNTVLGPPKGVETSDCLVLSAFKGEIQTTDDGRVLRHPILISCWKMTAAELQEVNRTGRIWLMVWGESTPPVTLLGVKPEFQ